MRKQVLSAVVATMALFASSIASAGLIGTTVAQCGDTVYSGSVVADLTACDGSTFQLAPPSALIGAGVEFSLTNTGTRTMDFGDNILSIFYNSVGSSSPDLFVFDFEVDITGISLISSNLLALTWAFSGDILGILISSPLVNGQVDLQINTATAVPEPGTLALLGLGLSVMGLARRRKKV